MRKFWYNMRHGQSAVEYTLALVGILGLVAVMGYLVTASWKSAERTVNLVEGDYP